MIALAPSHKAQLDNYTSWLEKRGFPYRILQEGDSLEGFSMLILCGGPDVGTAGKRDVMETNWFKSAYGKIPVLGICRGLQLSNVLLGGSLYEDLSNENIKHTANKVEIAGEPHPTLESSWHDVVLENGETIRVNSRHHQGINLLAKGLKSLATCPFDGLIEMAEGEKSLFVQWHPERPDVWGTRAEEIVYEWIKNNFAQTSPLEKPPLQKIFSYMKAKGFTTVSFERVQKSIDPSFDHSFMTRLILENANIVKKVKDKYGKIAIKKL